jgi:hypothetical protein
MDTLATRAAREWRVESELDSDEEVLSRTTRLVGSYLNAARWGEERLISHFDADRTARAGEKWITAFSADVDAESDQLAAFGHVGEIPLFPFNNFAIESLARAVMTRSDRLFFNPRSIINEVIRKLLLYGYQAFVENQFPPPALPSPRGFAAVETWLASLPVSEDTRRRLTTVVAIWGNSPSNVSEVGRIHPKVFEAFGLAPPAIDYQPAVSPKEQTTTGQASEPTKSSPIDEDPKLKALRSKLEAWVRNDSTLEQSVANKLRNLISSALENAVDWNAECHVRFKIQASHISIPKAGGQGNVSDDACIRIADSNEDPDGRLREELFAVLRLDAYETKYPERFQDLARAANLVDRLIPSAIALAKKQMHDKGRVAIQALAANSRILGIVERGRTLGAVHKFLFADVSEVDSPPGTGSPALSAWRSLQADAYRIRPQLKEMVCASFGCFQGTGQTLNGVDIVGIQQHFQIGAMPSDGVLAGAVDFQRAMSTMSKVRVTSLAKSALKDLAKEKATIALALGSNFEKSEVTDALKELAEKLRTSGRWADDRIQMSLGEFRALCEEFRLSSVKDAIEALSAAEADPDPDGSETFIARVGRIDPRPLLNAVRLVKAGQQMNAYATQYVEAMEREVEGIDLSLEAERITSILKAIEASIDSTLSGGSANVN